MHEPTAAAPEVIARNQREYGPDYGLLRWPSRAESRAASTRRRELLSALAGRAEVGCRGTKLDCTRLSPGCRLCSQGLWSCLFVNGVCNCRCFYCPTSQDEVGVPTTNTLTFPHPQGYLEYVERLGFRGVSLSGGEPLLTLSTTLGFAAAVKGRLGAGVHLWVYTNGTLASDEVLAQLRDAGVDEIRFDIGATGYDLSPPRRAVGVIPTVTVEVPAVPEDLEVMRSKLTEMWDSGIDYLNLHQLRLTPHNCRNLVERGYTFLHGDRVTVLESELTALEILRHALDHAIDLPVNYCSFVYKNRFQRAAARQRSGLLARRPYEEVTETGYLRSLHLTGSGEDLRGPAARLATAGLPPHLWSLSAAADRLNFGLAAWPVIAPAQPQVSVQYWEAQARAVLSYRHPFVEVTMGDGSPLFVERVRQGEAIALSGEGMERLQALAVGQETSSLLPAGAAQWRRLEELERIPAGLQEYG